MSSEEVSGQKEQLTHFLPSTGTEAGEYIGRGGSGAGLSGWEPQLCNLLAVAWGKITSGPGMSASQSVKQCPSHRLL